MEFVTTPLDLASTNKVQWKRSVQDIDGEVLCGMLPSHYKTNMHYLMPLSVSQFTLLASTKKGNKPDFHGAAKGEHAKELYEYFYSHLQMLYDGEKVKNGVFQAMMEVGLVNDGPVCLIEVLYCTLGLEDVLICWTSGL
jgi:D-aminoacyl-tRNA deacylase